MLLAALPLCAESVVLKNGFRVAAERHETENGVTRVFLKGGGSMEMSEADISRIDAEEAVATPPSTAKPATPEPAPVTDQKKELDEIIRLSAAKHGLDPDFIRSIIAAESGGNPRAVSPKGAAGLMQLMPGTARDLGAKDVFDPATNVEGGTAYIRELLARYNNDAVLALAAYNAGPGKVDAYKGLPPYRETNAYVTRVIKNFNKQKEAQEKAKQDTR